jgi:hypothetical protein
MRGGVVFGPLTAQMGDEKSSKILSWNTLRNQAKLESLGVDGR